MLLRATIHKDSTFFFCFLTVYRHTDDALKEQNYSVFVEAGVARFRLSIKSQENGLKQALQHLAFPHVAHHAPGVCTMAFYWQVIADELA